jgi:ABC-type sugar transport system ATPase subunit
VATLSLVELRKRFRRGWRDAPVVALDGLSLEVGEGEIVAIVGPSGCGTTTALRSVAGLESPDGGVVRKPVCVRTPST